MIAVIIPTLNAGRQLPATLASVSQTTLVKQVIVADGGSTDETKRIAADAGCQIVESKPGRGVQLRAGADAARQRWLLFLHADTVLAPGWDGEARAFIDAAVGRQRAAAFKLAFDDDSPAARRVLFWARLRARVLKLPYGDQGLLISRLLYDGLGGYRDMPIMEDLDFIRRIGRERLTILAAHAVTSADKYRRDGFERRAWSNLILAARYLMGADPEELAKAYR